MIKILLKILLQILIPVFNFVLKNEVKIAITFFALTFYFSWITDPLFTKYVLYFMAFCIVVIGIGFGLVFWIVNSTLKRGELKDQERLRQEGKAERRLEERKLLAFLKKEGKVDDNFIALVKIYRRISEIPHPPLGLLSIGNELKKHGYEVRVFHWAEDEVSDQRIRLFEKRPFIVGFSVITGDPLDKVEAVSRKIKDALPMTAIVYGGVHPTILPEQCLKESYIDYVVLNDGEKTMATLADAVKNNLPVNDIPGLAFKENRQVRINPLKDLEHDLDKYDMDWSLIDIENYINKDRVLSAYIASRGCPHQCAFCYNTTFNRRVWRNKSAPKVIEDINRLAEERGFKGVFLFDDNFMLHKDWAFEILNGLKVKVTSIDTRIDYIDDFLMQDFMSHGISNLFIGVESGSDRILSLLKKGFQLAYIYESLNIIKKYPIHAKLSFIFGLPTETIDEYRDTLRLIIWCIENMPMVGFNLGFYLPTPGTELFELCVESGFKMPDKFADWRNAEKKGKTDFPITWTKGFFLTPEEVRKMLIYIAWLRKNKNISRHLLKWRILHSGNRIILFCSGPEKFLMRCIGWVLARVLKKGKK